MKCSQIQGSCRCGSPGRALLQQTRGGSAAMIDKISHHGAHHHVLLHLPLHHRHHLRQIDPLSRRPAIGGRFRGRRFREFLEQRSSPSLGSATCWALPWCRLKSLSALAMLHRASVNGRFLKDGGVNERKLRNPQHGGMVPAQGQVATRSLEITATSPPLRRSCRPAHHQVVLHFFVTCIP